MLRFMVSPGQTVFARWKDGYYYPAIVDTVFADQIKVSYLDGYTGTVSGEHIVELQEAFKTMQFQGNWQNGGFFFKGVLASQEPLVMHYNDGDVEHVGLSQLRGVRPKATAKAARNPADARLSSARDPKAELEQLESFLKTGLITKAEYKRRKSLLR